MDKYRPLQNYLLKQSDPMIELTFREIEQIIGRELPPSAYAPRWWTNSRNARNSPLWQQTWQSAGYEAALIPGIDRVQFRQVPQSTGLPESKRSASIGGD